MLTKIKLCGMLRECDIDYANEAMPDYIGFVFYPKSFRNVSFDTAEVLRKKLSSKIKAVGVFVDENPENIKYLFKNGIIDIAQLHGNEDEQYIQNLKSITNGIQVIKAIRVKSENDVIKSEKLDADFLLFDTYKKGAVGGTGESFDRSYLRPCKKPFFLAGGLTPQNVSEAAKETGAYGVDLSSGVETEKFKDKNKMIEAVRRIRNE